MTAYTTINNVMNPTEASVAQTASVRNDKIALSATAPPPAISDVTKPKSIKVDVLPLSSTVSPRLGKVGFFISLRVANAISATDNITPIRKANTACHGERNSAISNVTLHASEDITDTIPQKTSFAVTETLGETEAAQFLYEFIVKKLANN